MQRDDVEKEPYERDFETDVDYQNHIFSMQNDGSVDRLKANYESFMKELSEINPAFTRIKPNNIAVGRLVGEFFGERYEEAGYFGGGEDR